MPYSVMVKMIALSQIFFALSNPTPAATTKTEFSDPNLLYRVVTEQPVIAFTFDDGPDPTFTPKILKELAKNHAKATFFVIGRKVARYPDIVKTEVSLGNEVGNHSFSHDLHMTHSSAIQQLTQTQEQVYHATGLYPKFFRPPMGLITPPIRLAAKHSHLRIIMWAWDQDTCDWNGRKASDITKQVLQHIHPGDIVLFHDGAANQSNTVAALQTLLPALEKRHFRMVTISELLQSTSSPNK